MLFGVGINDFESVHGYPAFTRVEGKVISDKNYKLWQAMISRCYSQYTKAVRPTYEGVSCQKSWVVYSNFYKDISNIHGFDNIFTNGWVLDKDILVKGNKIYSPETCCFVPKEINGCFTLRTLNRGKLPVGVTKNRYGHPYKARCGYDGKRLDLGSYNTPEEAFQAYKFTKKKEILRLANKWKSEISCEVYESLLKWNIEITD